MGNRNLSNIIHLQVYIKGELRAKNVTLGKGLNGKNHYM